MPLSFASKDDWSSDSQKMDSSDPKLLLIHLFRSLEHNSDKNIEVIEPDEALSKLSVYDAPQFTIDARRALEGILDYLNSGEVVVSSGPVIRGRLTRYRL